MKWSSLLIFFIILAVLVIFVIYGNKYIDTETEGFASFNYITDPTKPSLTQDVQLPAYRPTVKQLYDDIFFDQTNTNLVEVTSRPHIGNTDVGGNTVSQLIVTSRDRMSTIIPITQTISVGTTYDSRSMMSAWSYKSQSANTDFYEVFYVPWYIDTYIYMLNDTTKTHVGAWWFTSPSSSTPNAIQALSPNTGAISFGSYIDNDNSNGSKTQIETYYDPSKYLYQLSHFAKFDVTNGYLILRTTSDTANKSITYYDRTGKLLNTVTSSSNIGTTSSSVTSTPITSTFTIYDSQGQQLIVYMPNGTKTVIILITYASGTYGMKTFRFTPNGLDVGNGSDSGDNGWNDGYDNGGTHDRSPDYNSQFWSADDYILKTQVIPPVCPTCPACPGNVTCTNCGGNGGSGTLLGNGVSSIVGGAENIVGSGAGVLNNVVDTTGHIADKTIDTAQNLVVGTAIGAGLLAGGAVDAAGHVIGGAEKAIGGAALGAGALAGGALNAAGNVVGGVGNAVGGVAQGLGNAVGYGNGNGYGTSGQGQYILNSQGQYVQNPAYNNASDQSKLMNKVPMVLGTQNQYTDQYSYYGQLPTKQPTNFMPINSDFGAFAK